MMPHAIVLAAGRGARLGTRTQRMPKCAMRLAGRSLLDWQVAALRRIGVSGITLVAGYRAQVLRARPDVAVVVNEDWQHSGPIASLRCAEPQRHDAVLVVYADSLQHPHTLQTLCDAPGDVVFASDRQWHALWSLRFDNVLSDAECLCHANGRLLRIGGRAHALDQVQGQFAGVARFSRAGWQHAHDALATLSAERRRTLDTTGLFALLLERGVRIDAVPIDGRWCEVDSDRDLMLYRRLLRRRRWCHDWRWEHDCA